jgi:hypothetical protein
MSDQWQPISTAPKDGTAVWVGHAAGLMIPAFFRSSLGGGFWVELYTDLPTHWRPMVWQPLPNPPQAEEQETA